MDFQEAVLVVREHGISLLDDPTSNVRFVAVASKDSGPLAQATDFCVTAYVDHKLTATQLRTRGISTFAASFSSISGVEAGSQDIDVVETTGAIEPMPGLRTPIAQRGRYGGPPPALNAQKRFQQLRCGIGVTNPTNEYPNFLSVGTAGFYMTDDAGYLFLVSNNHVIGRSNAAVNGESIVQPGTLDLTDSELNLMPTFNKLINELEIGGVVGVVQLQFPTIAGTPNNTVDAAIAQLYDAGREFDDTDRVTYGGTIRGVAPAYSVDDTTGALNQSSRVYKVGRTTGYTEGNVVGVAGVANVPYDGGTARFVDQLIIAPTDDNTGDFSDSGDSGSGILNDKHELVGLLFAGNGQHTFANPIQNVVDQIRIASGITSLKVIQG
ncbi:hypothetical protein [uncultured Gimesia sp.]|uniref:hypothetical protein n=1 Tax=uncultured Gimesia sp. TaxID=1678688 RepID=UPI0030DB602D|tara:strand:- start:20654 stop:21796 length:1143 start_codon:yes stop_codon:yes gene_type:complete